MKPTLTARSSDGPGRACICSRGSLSYSIRGIWVKISTVATDSVENSIGSRLRLFAAFRGESLRALADRADIPYQTLKSYAADRSSPGAEQLTKLRSAGVRIEWLLTGEVDTPFPGIKKFERAPFFIGDDEFVYFLRRFVFHQLAINETRFKETAGRAWNADEAFEIGAHIFVEMAQISVRMADQLRSMIAAKMDYRHIAEVVAQALAPQVAQNIVSAAASEARARDAQRQPLSQ